MSAQFIGVGVGPGDPELLTLKAMRIIQQSDVVAYLSNHNGESQALEIAHLALENCNAAHLPIAMPMKNDRTEANAVYDQAAQSILGFIQQGKSVAFLCEGDPLFYGSFSYLLERLSEENISTQVIPGITSFSAASAELQTPLSMLTESVAILNGRHSQSRLIQALEQHNSLVIMKAGPYRPKIIQALSQSKRLQDARYLEYVGREQQKVVDDVSMLADSKGPYFSLFIVTASQRPD
ncbi:precorrin-2 C(20)-methyltransferase [Bacterioplanoides sp.]|uniref:precorrin-2 C(20)-methyltransferase n=1 Tax=Bacterioplanoides sp. TaxID=2066072 RepID=UPI003B5C62BD